MRWNGVLTPDISKMESLRKSGVENALDDCRGVVPLIALKDKRGQADWLTRYLTGTYLDRAKGIQSQFLHLSWIIGIGFGTSSNFIWGHK